MNVLVVDVGGTHVKVLVSGQTEARKFDSGARLVPGQEVSISTVTVLQPMFGEPGVYTTEFWTGGNRIGAMNLNVEERKPPAPVPADRPN